MRVVIDCNVLVSAARVDGVCRRVVDSVVRWHEIVLSSPIVLEHQLVSERPKHAPYRDALRAAIQEFERFVVFLEPVDVVLGHRRQVRLSRGADFRALTGENISGMSQSDLARALGTNPRQVQRYEATDYMGASLAILAEQLPGYKRGIDACQPSL